MMDNQARICHSPSPAGLGPTWGRGAATGTLADLANADCVLIMGSNMAETHVVAFQWVLEAKARGATVMHVDPRFTRTSAMADVYAQIRPGSDVAFLGALVNHVLSNGLLVPRVRARLHQRRHPRLARLRRQRGPRRALQRLGPRARRVRHHQLAVRHGPRRRWSTPGPPRTAGHGTGLQQDGSATSRHDGALTDPTLTDERCVLNVLRRHFARYTPDAVEQVCGIPAATFTDIADRLVAASGPDRTAYICYAVGWTMHVNGPQIIRTAAILQTLLGNIGRPGGGIMALRGHTNVQGTTDVSTLYETLPGYLAMPSRRGHLAGGVPGAAHGPRAACTAATAPTSCRRSRPGTATARPRTTGSGSTGSPGSPVTPPTRTPSRRLPTGTSRGYFVLGHEPGGVGAMHGGLQRKGLRKLRWLVVRDLDLDRDRRVLARGARDRARRGAPGGHRRPRCSSSRPRRTPRRAARSRTPSGVLQWHEKAVDPLGRRTSDLWWVHELGRRIKDRLADARRPAGRAAAGARVGLHDPRRGRGPRPGGRAARDERARRRRLAPVPPASSCATTGRRRAACWIYAGVVTRPGHQPRRRVPGSDDATRSGPSGAGPGRPTATSSTTAARRTPTGRPWSERKTLVWWDADAAGGPGTTCPTSR